MKFHPTPIIRYCYRYFLVALFILFPIYIMFGMTFNHAMVGEEDRVGFFLLGLVLLIVGSVLIHVGFWENFSRRWRLQRIGSSGGVHSEKSKACY